MRACIVISAQAGISCRKGATCNNETPAFAGVTGVVA